MNMTFVFAVALGLGIVGGLAASTGSVIVVGAFGGLGMAIFLAFAPSQLFAATLFFSMVIAGLAEFYFGIGQANWIPSLLALALFPAALFFRGRQSKARMNSALPGVGWLIAGYVTVLISSSLINTNSLIQILVGIRNYIPFIGVFIALQSFVNSDKDLKRWVHVLLLIGLIQFPFCLHQAIFIAPMRKNSLSAVGGGAESIVGTFGGNPLGGGYTGEMAVFVLIATLLAFALASSIRFGRVLSWLMGIFAIGCIALAETKIIFVLVPIAVVIVFYEEVRSSPKRMFGLLIAIFAILGGLAAVYAWRFWSKGPDEFWHAFTYSFDPNFMVDRLHRGRVGALVHWWNNHILHFDFLQALLGHGMASTLEGSRVLGEGSAVRAFGFGLDAHAANKLLWDSGLLGFGLFCWVVLRSGWNAHCLVGMNVLTEFHQGVMKVARAAMFCFAVMLPYQVSVVGGAPMQFLFWFFVGYVEYWRSQAIRNK
jgi:hypothetical protein